MQLTSGGRRFRVFLKRFMYSQLYLRDAFRVMFGKAKPFVPFKVEAEPPSVYFNFEISDERAATLQRELDLPFPLAPLSCIAGEAPFHCLTLNIYRVSGLVNGVRAEWSLYVRDADGVPRYLVVEAVADAASLDSVNLMTKPGETTHEAAGDDLVSTAAAEEGGRFSARIANAADGARATLAPDWTRANDFIYWRNGVCDRTFYGADMANPRVHLIEPANVQIEDTTSWGALANPVPRHVVVYEDAIEFAMSPWWNL